ncbi:MAG: hypothetical protein ACM3PT_13170 [Deltaproteobacteria bacterium]
MKKLWAYHVILVAITVFASCKNEPASSNTDASGKEKEKTEEIVKARTFIVKYKTTVNYKDVINESISTQWIDVENDKVAIETESEIKMMGKKMKNRDLTIIKNNETWLINLIDKSAYKAGKSKLLDQNQSEFIKADSDESFRQKVEASGGKIVGNESVLGKNCIVIELPDSSGKSEMKSKMWYYQGIPLKMSNSYYNMEAVEIQENVDIPAEKFEVPAGIKIKDMQGMK